MKKTRTYHYLKKGIEDKLYPHENISIILDIHSAKFKFKGSSINLNFKVVEAEMENLLGNHFNRMENNVSYEHMGPSINTVQLKINKTNKVEFNNWLAKMNPSKGRKSLKDFEGGRLLGIKILENTL